MELEHLLKLSSDLGAEQAGQKIARELWGRLSTSEKQKLRNNNEQKDLIIGYVKEKFGAAFWDEFITTMLFEKY